MARRRTIGSVLRTVWITVGLGATAVFVTWSLLAYRSSAEANLATVSDAAVTVAHEAGTWRFEPAVVRDGPTLVFFPGALVDPRAYAPLARAVAVAGHRVVLVELPRRGAFGGADGAELQDRLDRVWASLGDPRSVVLGGHSRGGVVASAAAARHPDLGGLVLIGTSHPRDVDLSGLDAPVTKIVGTRDGLASPAEVEANAALLPPHTRWIWVEGGNHSQFGWYGFQPLDRRATIAAVDQRALMIDGVLELLNGL
jgi:pimeloyl-ACP methyl ester carboxylesterase